ncbi:MAG: VWA domain-containing protein [Bacteroidota bacterium]|nr:VWA domain-containing protein [Bacteroidota bacterium]
MSFRRLHGAGLVAAACVVLLLTSACDSPLEVETPRNRYADNVSVLPGEDIGTPVSVDVPIDTTGGHWTPAHFSAALVLDASGSITSEMNRYLRQSAGAFLDSLDGSVDEGMVVHFSGTATIYQGLTTDVAALRSAVDSLPRSGATAMWDAVYSAMRELNEKGSHTRKAVILITDSDDNSSSIGTATNTLEYAEGHGIMIFTITMRLSSHELVLRNIADRTGGRHYSQPRLSSLNSIYRGIAAILRRP